MGKINFITIKKMKKPIIFILLGSIFFSCYSQVKNNNIILVELKKEHQAPEYQDYNQIGNYIYDSNNNLTNFSLECKKFSIKVSFDYEKNIIIRKTTKNSNKEFSSIIDFEYKNGKLYKESVKTLVNDEFQLSSVYQYKYFDDKIIKEAFKPNETSPVYEEIITLDKNGKTIYSSLNNAEKSEIKFDNKINPINIMFPEYLNGSVLLYPGNIISKGKESFTYEYNKYDLPTIQKEYRDGKLFSTTTYKYK
jgi:hypothetical protein